MATRAMATAPPHRGGSKQAWLDEGLRTLADEGAPALRIDRLAGRLGLSKGSFYHHFDGMAGYKDALLAHFEREHTSRFIDAVESRTDLVAEAKLRAAIVAGRVFASLIAAFSRSRSRSQMLAGKAGSPS